MRVTIELSLTFEPEDHPKHYANEYEAHAAWDKEFKEVASEIESHLQKLVLPRLADVDVEEVDVQP